MRAFLAASLSGQILVSDTFNFGNANDFTPEVGEKGGIFLKPLVKKYSFENGRLKVFTPECSSFVFDSEEFKNYLSDALEVGKMSVRCRIKFGACRALVRDSEVSVGCLLRYDQNKFYWLNSTGELIGLAEPFNRS